MDNIELLKTLAPSKLYRHSERKVPFKEFVEEYKFVNATGQSIESFFKKHEVSLEKKKRLASVNGSSSEIKFAAQLEKNEKYSTKQMIGFTTLLIAIGIVVYKIQ